MAKNVPPENSDDDDVDAIDEFSIWLVLLSTDVPWPRDDRGNFMPVREVKAMIWPEPPRATQPPEPPQQPEPPRPRPSQDQIVDAICSMARGRTITQQPVLVIKKRINQTDMSENNNRLAIPYNKVVNKDFLSGLENDRLVSRETKRKKISDEPYKKQSPCSIEVKVLLVPSLECVAMDLKRWDMGSSFIYVLTRKWTEVARRNGIALSTLVRVWAFRIEGEENVCFALEKDPNDAHGEEDD